MYKVAINKNPITRRQYDVLLFIRYFIRENRRSPDLREIADGIGIKSSSGAGRLVRELEDRGYLVRLVDKEHNIRLT